MAIDTTSPRSRRALLTAAVGGAAAAVVATVARLAPVEAANGDTVNVGGNHTGTSLTAFTNSANANGAIGGFVVTGSAVAASTFSGIGVNTQSQSGNGLALRVVGRIKVIEVSGVATIKKGKKSVTVSPGVDINIQTFVLLTPMVNMGSRALWFTRTPSTNKFVIRMSSTRGGPTKIAWLALERG
jgi:hypothetical protein